jgi:uncharacterized protein (DUF342 family)
MNDQNQRDFESTSTKFPASLPEGRQDIFGQNNKNLITLAIKCRLIPLDREKELLTLLAEKRQQIPDYSAVTLFTETKSLSRENIKFLFAVKDHLETKMLDKKFGELGIANQFVQPENVKKAMDIQSAIFKETNQSRLIGDILLENKEISRADKSAILLTQDRVKDEMIAEVMNDIATSEIEKISLNMRFGAIAVKKEMVTIDQLNHALKVQKSEENQGQPRRYLGDIFKQLFNLSPKDLDYILKIQKELEKNRLALENALSQYNSEESINKRLSKLFGYRFSKNKLAAFLQKTKEGFEETQVQDLITWLNAIGITSGICPGKIIKKFLAQATIGMEIQIAQGLPPRNGQDESVEFFFDTDFRPSDGDSLNLLPLVKKGDALARSIPPRKGTPGKDVSGFSIPAPLPRTISLNCGEGVSREEDLFIATADGMPCLYKKRTLFVKAREQTIATRNHTGAIDTDLGDRYLDVNLRVEGSISPGGKVRCQGLDVNGDIFGQAAAAGDIRVKGQIGQSKKLGKDPAKIRAEGDILVNKPITNAILITAKSLKAPKSNLISSAVLAFQDIVINNVSDDGTRPSILQTGKNPNVKVEGINTLIQNQTAQLDHLKHKAELDELEKTLNTKLQVKEEYLKQHEIFKTLLTLMQCEDLDPIPSLGEKLRAAKNNPDVYPGLPPLFEHGRWPLFLEKFLDETGDMDKETLKHHVDETADIKYGMYRAAVNATRRHHHEYEAQKKIILKKVEIKEPDILKKEENIKKLIIRKDTLLLSQGYRTHPVPPAIKVKNRVQKGTVIMGQKARLTVDRDIYGVKFTEIQKNPGEDPVITIEGVYE